MLKLSEKLKRLRKKRKMSLYEAARISSTSKSYLWELENNENRNPTILKLKALAKTYQVELESLL